MSYFWCLIQFITWRYSQSCWYFRPLLWTSAPLNFSQVHLPPPPPSPHTCVNNRGTCIHSGGIVGLGQINTCRRVWYLYWSIFWKSQHLGFCVFIDILSFVLCPNFFWSVFQARWAAGPAGAVQPRPVCLLPRQRGALRGRPGAARPARPHPPGHARDQPPRQPRRTAIQAARATFLPLARRTHGLALLKAVPI